MFLFTRRIRPAANPRPNTRSILGVEQLDHRVAPVNILRSVNDPTELLATPLFETVASTTPLTPLTDQKLDTSKLSTPTQNAAAVNVAQATPSATRSEWNAVENASQIAEPAQAPNPTGTAADLAAQDSAAPTTGLDAKDLSSSGALPPTKISIGVDSPTAKNEVSAREIAAQTGNGLPVSLTNTTSVISGSGKGSTHGFSPDESTALTITFDAKQVSPGFYSCTGDVTDNPSPVGLTVQFSGVPSFNGESTTVMSTCTYNEGILVKLDGSDTGMVYAQVTDAAGDTATAMEYITP